MVSNAARAAVEVPDALRQAEEQRIATMERAAKGVVAIFSPSGNGGGSGVLIEPTGYAVTNFHVVQGMPGFMKCGLNDGKIYDAVVVGVDPTGDVALIQMLGRDDFPVAEIGNSDQVRVGDAVFAMGNPFLLATDYRPTVTYGMVSGTHRYQYPAGTFLEYTDCLQVDASINPGNSGGPLFNSQGQVIGINGRISVEKRGRVNVGAGYAISINQVMNFLDHLKSGRIVDHATLGAVVASNSDGAVVVSRILESSEAYRRGLRRDDELVAFAGRPIRSVNQFKNVLGIYPRGWTIPLSFRRDGRRHDIFVRLMALHRQAELTGPAEAESEPEDPDRPQLPDELFSDNALDQVPEEYADLYDPRPGYANYAYNEQHQQRLLKSVANWGDFSKSLDGWALAGPLTTSDGSLAVEVRLQPEALVAKLGEQFFLQQVSAEPQDVPPNTGGLLMALSDLYHLLAKPRDSFTELYYLGSEPLPRSDRRVDVLITTHGLVISRWYFDQENGNFIGFDTQLNEQSDPCEIRFDAMREFSVGEHDGLRFPKTMSVRHASADYGTWQIESLQFFKPTSQPGGEQ